MKPFYRCYRYGDGLTHLHAITSEGADVLLSTAWNIAECRQYAMDGKFTVEKEKIEDGVKVFEWHQPDEKEPKA